MVSRCVWVCGSVARHRSGRSSSLASSTPRVRVRDRQMMIDEFNRRGNKTTRVFLLSTRAGNMGINLVAANRVILMDTSWNPANDLQAMFR